MSVVANVVKQVKGKQIVVRRTRSVAFGPPANIQVWVTVEDLAAEVILELPGVTGWKSSPYEDGSMFVFVDPRYSSEDIQKAIEVLVGE